MRVGTVHANYVSDHRRQRELWIKGLDEGWILRSADAAPEESQEGCRGDGALVRGTHQFRKEAFLTQASGRIADLPLRVVEVVIGSPDSIGSLETCRALIDEHHAVKRLGSFQVKYITITIGQYDGPGQTIGIQAIGMTWCSSLSIHGTNLKHAFKGNRCSNARRPWTAGSAKLLIGRAHTFAAA